MRGSAEVANAGWRPAATALLLAAAFAAATWLKSDLPNNDFERFEDLRLTVVFFLLIGAACIGYAALALDARAVRGPALVTGGVGAALLLLAAYPVGSKDVLLYAFTGKIWGTYGANPYVVAPASFAADPLHAFFDVGWADRPSPYGPLFIWQARLLNSLAGGTFFAAVWLHKSVAVAALGLTVVLGARLLPPGPARLTLLAWNPLLLFESAASGHNDAVMLLLIVAVVSLHRRGAVSRWRWAPAVLALAIWYKWYALLFVPVFGIAVARDGGPAELRRWAIAIAAFVAAIGAVLLAPLLAGVPALAARLGGHEDLRDVLPLQMSPVLQVLYHALSAAGVYERGSGWLWFDALRLALFGASAAAVLAQQARGRCDERQAICLLATAFTMLMFSVLWPWHLQMPALFALLSAGVAFEILGVALTGIALLSYFLTFTWAAASLGLAAAALWTMRARRPRPRG